MEQYFLFSLADMQSCCKVKTRCFLMIYECTSFWNTLKLSEIEFFTTTTRGIFLGFTALQYAM